MRPAAPLAAGLAVGVVADAVFGDPARGHPVAGFGRAAAWLERRLWRPSRLAGAVFTSVSVGAALLAGAGVARGVRRVPAARTALTALACWGVLGGRSLHRTALDVATALGAGDLDAARARLPALCGRDPAELDEDGIVRATVESVAENTADAVVAPLVWGAAAGLPGLVGYRAVNTLDAMVGHRSARYASFGWAAARLDDAANWLPARLTGVLAVLLAPRAGGRRGTAWRVLHRDGDSHPSPNAGRCEAAFAGALGRTLGGVNSYAGRVEERPLLGEGPAPLREDIARAVHLSRAVALGAAGLAVGTRALLDLRRRRPVTVDTAVER